MNFIAQVEEHLRDLGTEARKKHPGVKEASERAILQLRTLQNAYVTAVRKANQTGGEHPTTALFQSQDLLRPFLLAANYPNASPKLLDISLRGMSLLMKGNAICPGDGIHMVRVWTIQANVCASALSTEKQRNNKSPGRPSNSSSASSSSSFSPWFSMLSSSSSTDVSSSSGQGSPQKKECSEKLALDLLRCLILLLENEELTITDEQWTGSLALCCILGHVHVMVVQQAAKTSLHQVLSFLFVSTTSSQHALETWRDLLILASQEPTALRGAFSQCKSSAPSPTLCLELLSRILRGNPQWFSQNLYEIEIESLQVSKLMLEDTSSVSFELVWRSYAFASAVLTVCEEADEEESGSAVESTGDDDDDDEDDDVDEVVKEADEAREQLVEALVHGIVRATEICRNNHDFEDGYVYTASDATDVKLKSKSQRVTLIPDSLLWRAGLALETIHVIIEKSPHYVSIVAEAVSDFATIGASCQDHMLMLVDCSQRCFKDGGDKANMPSLFRRAEEIQSAALASQKLSENPKNLPSTSCDIGEALWVAFHCILELSRFVDDETSFAPSLAVLQHFLKRFPGSREMTHSTLRGYDQLSHVIESGSPIHRTALLSSLCKLSLPSWGKHDVSTQLFDHHIEALLCLLKIVHRYRDDIESEWQMILGTFTELSSMNVASPKLSEEGYKGAVMVSTVYSRFAPLTTVLSEGSLTAMLQALVEIAQSSPDKRSSTPVPDSSISDGRQNKVAAKEEGSISGKLISFAGKAILGGDKPVEIGKPGSSSMKTKAHRIKTSYAGSYKDDFHRRLSPWRTLRTESLGELPFSVLLLTDISMSNTFRFKECGSAIFEALCKLAGSSKESRSYAMDLLSLLVTAQLSNEKPLPAGFIGPSRVVSEEPSRSQFFEVVAQDDGQSLQNVSQVDLLSPLCDTIKFTKQAGVAEAGMSSLCSLLEGSGHNLSGNVWAIVIEAVSSLAGDASYEIDRTGADWSECCALAFRGLKLIVDEFLDALPPPSDDSSIAPRKALMECCSSFGRSRHDVNTSLTAIGLLWTIADQDADSSSIERALDKLVLLAADIRTEVRNCAVNTLFSCIVGKGQTFSKEQWERCIRVTVFAVYDQVLSRGGNTDESTKEMDKKGKYKTSVHHSRDSTVKQWATTEVLVIHGLNRVLRNNFSQLLDSTGNVKVEPGKSTTTSGTPWFVGAWTRILEIALHAAKRFGGRDTLDLRTSGLGLGILCCQLSCRAGIQAAITPARVGTNMEVVNGALRSVGVSEFTKIQDDERNVSESVSKYREQLFVASFDALSDFHDHLENGQDDNEDLKSMYMEPVQVQILHGLVGGLSKLFDCCKDEELHPDGRGSGSGDFERPIMRGFFFMKAEKIERNDYEARFVALIATIAGKAVSEQKQFLSQAQRSAIELLQDMVAKGSNQSLKALAAMAGEAFFWDPDRDSKNENDAGELRIDAISREAANVVSDKINNDLLSAETKVEVLGRLLFVFLTECSEDGKLKSTSVIEASRCYKPFTPVIESGLSSAEKLKGSGGTEFTELLGVLWERVETALSVMLSPIQTVSRKSYISEAINLAALVQSAASHAPPEQRDTISALLSSGALRSIQIAKDHANYSSRDSDDKTLLKKRHDDALKLCLECMGGLCKVHPQSSILQSIAKQIFDEALETFQKEKDPNETSLAAVNIEIAMVMCQAIRQCNQIETLVIALFPQLCLLIAVDHASLRNQLSSIMKTVNVGKTIADATARMNDAERRAEDAESENRLLTAAIQTLRSENSQLQRDIAVFSTSSALS